MIYIFIWYLYNIIVPDSFSEKFGQSLLTLSFKKKEALFIETEEVINYSKNAGMFKVF
jgi:hypothetical protein